MVVCKRCEECPVYNECESTKKTIPLETMLSDLASTKKEKSISNRIGNLLGMAIGVCIVGLVIIAAVKFGVWLLLL